MKQKFVLKLDLHDDKDKRKALKTVSTLPGIDVVSMDMKSKTLTVIGTVDPVKIVSKLRKFWPTNIVLVGPAKEPEKKEEPKKEEAPKKDEAKKEEPKKEEGAKKEEEPKKEEEAKKKEEEPKKKEGEEKKPQPQPQPQPELVPVVGTVMPYRPYYPPMNRYYYMQQPSMEENPNACVIS